MRKQEEEEDQVVENPHRAVMVVMEDLVVEDPHRALMVEGDLVVEDPHRALMVEGDQVEEDLRVEEDLLVDQEHQHQLLILYHQHYPTL